MKNPNIYPLQASGVALLASLALGVNQQKPDLEFSPILDPQAKSADCRLGSPNYEPMTCGQTKQFIINECTKVSTAPLTYLKTDYEGSSHEKIRLRFKTPDDKGCIKKGVRKYVLFEEIEKPGDDNFVKVGKSVSVTTMLRKSYSKLVDAPVDCSDPNSQSIKMRTSYTATFKPKKGWPKPTRKTTRTYNGKIKSAC